VSINAPFTKEEYLKMFSASPAMHGSRAKLLRFHFAQKDYLASAPEMAKAMGCASFSAANLRYGTFARELAKSMCWSGRIAPGRDCAISVLARFREPDAEHPSWEWERHPEAVQALKEPGW